MYYTFINNINIVYVQYRTIIYIIITRVSYYYNGILCAYSIFVFLFCRRVRVIMNNDIIYFSGEYIKYGTHVVRATRLQRAAKTYNNYCYYVSAYVYFFFKIILRYMHIILCILQYFVVPISYYGRLINWMTSWNRPIFIIAMNIFFPINCNICLQ